MGIIVTYTCTFLVLLYMFAYRLKNLFDNHYPKAKETLYFAGVNVCRSIEVNLRIQKQYKNCLGFLFYKIMGLFWTSLRTTKP